MDFATAVQSQDLMALNNLLDKDSSLIDQLNDPLSATGGDTPLMVAVKNNQLDTVPFWLMCGAKTGVQHCANKRTAIHMAAHLGHTDVLKRLLDKSRAEDLNKSDVNGQTALHAAVEANKTKCVQLLMKNDEIEVNVQDNAGNTPLHLAFDQGKQMVFCVTRSEKIDYGVANCKGITPLHLAAKMGMKKLVDQIIDRMPHIVNNQSNDGTTALHLASMYGHWKTASSLLDVKTGKASVTLKSNTDRTALHCAVNGVPELYDSDRTALVHALLLHPEIEVDAVDHNGRTAAHMAARVLEAYLETRLVPKDQLDPIKVLMTQTELDLAAISSHLFGPNKSTPAPLWSLALLVWFGAKLSVKDKSDRSVSDWINNSDIKVVILEIVQKANEALLLSDQSVANACRICFEHPVGVALECGHLLCSECADNPAMEICYFCKTAVSKEGNRKIYL